MKSKEYLRTKLNEVSNIFPELTFMYQFNGNTRTHIVEVKPLDDYQSNDSYAICEAELIYAFEKEFFPETVLFVSEESLTQVTEPEFVIRKQIFVNAALKANYCFELNSEMEDLFCVKSDCDYAFAA